jgi:hypothetical protein
MCRSDSDIWICGVSNCASRIPTLRRLNVQISPENLGCQKLDYPSGILTLRGPVCASQIETLGEEKRLKLDFETRKSISWHY